MGYSGYCGYLFLISKIKFLCLKTDIMNFGPDQLSIRVEIVLEVEIGGIWSLFHALTKVPSFLPSFLITPLLMSSAMGRSVLCKTFLCSDKQGWLGWWLRVNIDSGMMTSSCSQFINSRQAWDFSLGTWHYWLLFKITFCIKPYLVASNGELLTV